MSLAVYHIARTRECTIIYGEGHYSSILVQYPFYNILPNISVCDNYISPYFFATCIHYNSAILFISRLLACKYRFTWNLSSAYQTLRRKYGMQYRSRCNILTHSEMLYFFGIFIKNLHDIFDTIL